MQKNTWILSILLIGCPPHNNSVQDTRVDGDRGIRDGATAADASRDTGLDAGPATPTTAAAFKRALNESICHRIARCSDKDVLFEQAYRTHNECVLRLTDATVYDGLTYNVSMASECLRELESSDCGATWNPPACASALSPRAPVGSSCGPTTQCAVGSTCDTQSCRCELLPTQGQSCGQRACAAELRCTTDTRLCVREERAGDVCTGIRQCGDRMNCVNGHCASFTTLRNRNLGESCEHARLESAIDYDTCRPGLRCVFARGDAPGVCAGTAELGESCQDGRACREGSYCDANQGSTCRELKRDGESCFAPQACVDGSLCGLGTSRCERWLEPGSVCAASEQCRDLHCVFAGGVGHCGATIDSCNLVPSDAGRG